jgi:hypothetical protein
MFDNGYDGPSILKPQGDLAEMIDAMTYEEYALFVIALARKDREDAAVNQLTRACNTFAQRY